MELLSYYMLLPISCSNLSLLPVNHNEYVEFHYLPSSSLSFLAPQLTFVNYVFPSLCTVVIFGFTFG